MLTETNVSPIRMILSLTRAFSWTTRCLESFNPNVGVVKVTLNVVVEVVEVERHKHQRKRDRSTDIIRKNKCL